MCVAGVEHKLRHCFALNSHAIKERHVGTVMALHMSTVEQSTKAAGSFENQLI
jgi:hypothetical protein